jgi:two-component system phosphate regulon response regulator PhoB
MSDAPPIVLEPFDPPLACDLARELAVTVEPLEAIRPRAKPPLIFIDWLLPDGSGFERCRQLRAEPASSGARLVLVLEDDDRETRRRALQCGADDYVTGPLTVAGVRAKLGDSRPPSPRAGNVALHGQLRLDLDAFQVRAGGVPIPMSPNEFRLLAFFMDNRDRVLSRNHLIEALKEGGAVDERTVDVWIGRLRRALVAANVPDPIRTVRHLGYVYDSF